MSGNFDDELVIRSSPLFDEQFYMQKNPDVIATGLDSAAHYLIKGNAEDRDPGPSFSTKNYLLLNPDVALAGMNALLHYELHGRAEGRQLKPASLSIIDWLTDMALNVPGFRGKGELNAIAEAVIGLPANSTIVEIGVYMGQTTVVLAGVRRIADSGQVHCIDPFDCSGDDYSVPFYVDGLAKSGFGSLEEAFIATLRRFRLEALVSIHKGASRSVAKSWGAAIDLLLLDGDQSTDGAREAFEDWIRFVAHGGTVILGNTLDREYDPSHIGNYLIASRQLVGPRFKNVYRIGAATFAQAT